VIGRRVNLRAGPSTDDRVLRVLVARTPVLPERRRGDWTLVLTPAGQIGWVHDSLLSPSQTTQSLPASLAR
jgi:SH3-like domain-containing protein